MGTPPVSGDFPVSVANRDGNVPNSGPKSGPRKGANAMPKMGGGAPVRYYGSEIAAPRRGRLSAIPQNCRKVLANPSVSANFPFW